MQSLVDSLEFSAQGTMVSFRKRITIKMAMLVVVLVVVGVGVGVS